MSDLLRRRSLWVWAALLSTIALATFLRVWRLDVTPPGLHYDEAFKAINAREILRTGQLQVFFPGNFGEEPMHATLGALIFWLVGPSAWAIRLSSVVFGIVAVPAVYFCARTLLRSTRIALAAAFITATLYWAVNFSRIAIEPIALALLITLHLGTLWWALTTDLRAPRARLAARYAAAGFFAGATYYTYLASRATPGILVLFGLYLLLFYRRWLLARWKWLALAALVALIVIAPLALYFVQNPVAFTARAGQVITPGAIQNNLVATAGMFFFHGDEDPRDNLPGRAALDPLLAILFVAGILVSLRRRRDPPYALLLIWLVVLTAPAILTEFAPNFRRSLGALPAVVILCAVGLDALVGWARGHVPSGATVAPVLAAVALAISALVSARAYFVDWASSPGLYYSFDAGLLQVGRMLGARPPDEQLCLSPSYTDHPTILWALNGRPYTTFDGRKVAVLPDSALPTTCAIITYEDQQFSPSRYWTAAQTLATVLDLENKPYARLYRVAAGTALQATPSSRTNARLGDAIDLLGYDIAREGNRIDVTLYWHAASALKDDYTAFVHLIGPQNPETNSPVWSQDDAQPGHGTYPTDRWRAGDTILDRYTLRLPDGAPPGQYRFEAGMYLLATGARLPVQVDGQRVAEDRVVFGEFSR